MASNAVFFLVKSHISSISTLGKVAFSNVLITDLPLLLPIHFIWEKMEGGEGERTHNNIQMVLIIEKLKKRKRIPELVLILLMVLKQVTFSGLKVSFSITTIWERNLII